MEACSLVSLTIVRLAIFPVQSEFTERKCTICSKLEYDFLLLLECSLYTDIGTKLLRNIT